MHNEILLSLCILYLSCSKAAEIKEIEEPVPDCDSQIYCHGDFLRIVQLSKNVDNSLDFVNMKLKYSPKIILDKFKTLDQNGKNFETELATFIKNYFEPHQPKPAADELKEWKLMDNYKVYIHDEKYRDFYETINEFWKQLAESTTVEFDSKYYSMIHLPNLYIKAFENSNDLPLSWQSYLIVRGLLSNQMFETAAGIIRNYAELIKNHNFALLSNRVYWSQRSSLPFLALMAQEYIEEMNANDTTFINELLPSITKDFLWWYDNRRVEITKNEKKYKLFRYHHCSSESRPENYKDDHELAEKIPIEDRNRFYSALRDLDESIFKFSSRFVRAGKYTDDRLNLDVTNRIPVELNCLLLKTVEIIASWNHILGSPEHRKYSRMAAEIATAINEVLYDEEKGAWFDWDISNDDNDPTYYITNLVPIYTIGEEDGGLRTENAVKYMMTETIITPQHEPNYWLIPTSMDQLGAEWDYPHGSLLWNIFIIGGLRKSKYKKAQNLANNLAHLLIKKIHNEFESHKHLLEHYRVINPNAGNKRLSRKQSRRDREESSNTQGSSSSTQESNKIAASTLGATIELFKLFGRHAESTDYNDFQPGRENIRSQSFAKKSKISEEQSSQQN